MADQRQRIIASVFSRRNAAGNLEESYVSHIKIWEDAGPEGRKPRYILLSQAINGSGFIHKSKLNTNGTFSVGKTWRLAELRGVQVPNPLSFNLTLARTYKWQTESREDQTSFLEALIRLFRSVTNGQIPLQLEGISYPDAPAENVQAQAIPRDIKYSNDRAPSPSGSTVSKAQRSQTSRAISQTSSEDPRRNPSPVPQLHSRTRPASPVNSQRERENRPPSIAVPPPSALVPSHRARVPSTTSIASQGFTNGQDPNHLRTTQGQSVRQRVDSRSGASSPSPSVRARTQQARSENVSNGVDSNVARRDQNARISYFDPANQAMLDRLILGSDLQIDGEGEEENAQATLSNVEEMIEGYEWASDDVIGRKMTRGAVDLIEARLLDELMALEKANIHSFLESDDRVAVVMKYMDDAINELDNMDGLISTYKIHLNAVADDILYIQSQNRGLQVQTQNQRALLGELQNLLRTVHVDEGALSTLTKGSLEKTESITSLEEAAAQLYKALQAGRDTEMAATMERLQEYRTYNSQFCKRLFDFLSIMFIAQSSLLLGDTSGLSKSSGSRPTAISHSELEIYLGRYAGLLIYLREMDENVYSKLCATYFSAASDLHSAQIKALLTAHLELVKRADEDMEQGFGAAPTPVTSRAAAAASGMRRAGTILRSPIESRQRDKKERPNGDLCASEVFGLFLEQVAKLVYQEDEFIADFLQINDSGFTFADYMGLDNYFRRQAARSTALSPTTLKLIRGALDFIFGFLPTELKSWLDAALAKDSIEVVGILAFLERFMIEAEEKGNPFVMNLLDKQHSRLKIVFDRHISEQLKNIEKTKLSSKKRKGVANFIKHFAAYAARIEHQLIGASNLEIRTNVDSAYERIVQSMFDSLKQIAKLEGEGEDKGQLNYHVILIENMNYFVVEMSQLDVPSLNTFTRRAEGVYDENLAAYIKIVFRRPFGKIIDFFESVERFAKESSTTEVASNSNFNKNALRKVVKDYNSKDIKKSIDVLSKRVEKHFTDSDKMTGDESSNAVSSKILGNVWNACETEFVKLTESWALRISQSYGDSNITLEYTVQEAEAAFRRQKFFGP